MKGLIVFYCNHYPDKGQDPVNMIEIARNQNAAVLDKLIAEGYQICFVPTTNESTRVEKIDLEVAK